MPRALGTIGPQALGDEVGLIFQNADGVQYLAARIFTDPCRTADQVGNRSGGNELRDFSLRHYWINSSKRPNSGNAGPENEQNKRNRMI